MLTRATILAVLSLAMPVAAISAPTGRPVSAAGNSWRATPEGFVPTAEAERQRPIEARLPPFPGRDGAVLWSHLPDRPTVSTSALAGDWCGAASVTIELYAEAQDGDVVFADVTDATGDNFVAGFRIDWHGWKNLTLPLKAFRMARAHDAWTLQPAPDCNHGRGGWHAVTGLRLVTKLYNYEPNPATRLAIGKAWLDDRAGLENQAAASAALIDLPDYPAQTRTPYGLDIAGDVQPYGPENPRFRWLNHTGPEVAEDAPLSLPVTYRAYFRNERALLGYFPRYIPGTVNVTPRGLPVILAQGNLLEYAGRDGHWQTLDVTRALVDYARSRLGFHGRVMIANSGLVADTSLGFDRDGDIYMLQRISDADRRKSVNLLLHKSARGDDWEIYPLPYGPVNFERFTGHNRDLFSGPPPLLLSRYLRDYRGDLSLYLPRKLPDGRLQIGAPIPIARAAITPDPHSGRASQVLSDGDAVYVVYALPAAPGGRHAGPGDLPGVPSYIRRYDRSTGVLSAPVWLGNGGTLADDRHDWPSLAMDSRGYLHVVINGHNSPFHYTRSLRPHDISAWTKPESVGAGTSYLGLVIGPDDTVYSVARDSQTLYRFDLMLYRLRPGGVWERKDLVAPFRSSYAVWYHNLSIDPVSGHLFLSYNSQSPALMLAPDEARILTYQRPDFAALQRAGNADEAVAASGGAQWYDMPSDERVILTSADGGDTWRLALTGDLLPPPDCTPDTHLLCR